MGDPSHLAYPMRKIKIETMGETEAGYFENIPIDVLYNMMRVADKYSDWTQRWNCNLLAEWSG
jgi:hypothetical protein